MLLYRVVGPYKEIGLFGRNMWKITTVTAALNGITLLATMKSLDTVSLNFAKLFEL